MYYIQELFCRLANGALNNTAFKSEEDGEDIRAERQTEVTIAVNEALARLHARFPLRTDSVIVEMQVGRTNYPLLKKYAATQYDASSGIDPYIMDLAGEPFDDDVIKILSVRDSHGWERPLNDKDKVTSVFTPRPNVLQNNHPKYREALSVTYQTKHPKVTCDETGAQVIEIPDSLDEALDSYIAYKCFTHIGTQDATAKAVEHLQRYEDICSEVVEYDLVNSAVSNSGSKFNARGFV